MMGQLLSSGTGVCDILLDEEEYINNINNVVETEDDYLEINESNIDILMDNEEYNGDCNDHNFKFSYE